MGRRKDGMPRVIPDLTEEIVAKWSDDVSIYEEPTHTLEYDE